MTSDIWAAFKSQTRYAVKETFGWDTVTTGQTDEVEAYEAHEGTGWWDGRSEDSYKYTALIAYEVTDETLTRRLGILRDRLGVLAGDYKQDAIALTIGESTLISARVVA